MLLLERLGWRQGEASSRRGAEPVRLTIFSGEVKCPSQTSSVVMKATPESACHVVMMVCQCPFHVLAEERTNVSTPIGAARVQRGPGTRRPLILFPKPLQPSRSILALSTLPRVQHRFRCLSLTPDHYHDE